MARPKSTPEQREAVRNRIQKAASDLYNQDGIAAISARAVARKASVSVGTIYAHFGDLTGLMQSLWIPTVERQAQVFRAKAGEYKDPVQRLRILLMEYLRFGIETPELYRGALMFVRPAGLEKPDAEPLSTVDFADLLIETLKEGRESGQFVDGPPEVLAQMLWSGVHGCLALPVNMDRVALAPARDVSERTVELLLKAVRA
ncbi:MAG: TetR/AcrR family transcriptional regulator [Henriciella sp.]|nr:TetR/AcrR family transcriptional regulator [Henriciella sp.]